VTDIQARALAILAKHGPVKPRQFSELMWPDNPAHQRHGKVGENAVALGVGMHLAGGAYLGKLRKRGWAGSHFGYQFGVVDLIGYVLTKEGRKALAEHKETE